MFPVEHSKVFRVQSFGNSSREAKHDKCQDDGEGDKLHRPWVVTLRPPIFFAWVVYFLMKEVFREWRGLKGDELNSAGESRWFRQTLKVVGG